MKSLLWKAAIFSSVHTQVCHPIPLHFPSCGCKKHSSVSMLLRNTLGLLKECFPAVVGCIICYSSCSRSASELDFLTQTGVVVRYPETWVGKHTAQKHLANYCWICPYGWGRQGWRCHSAICSGCSHTAPGSSQGTGASKQCSQAPGGCACLEVNKHKHSASHRC